VSTSNSETTWLSQDAYDRLAKELEELIAHRPAMAAEINARREEGDLRENTATTPLARSRASRKAGFATCRNSCAPRSSARPRKRTK